LPFGSVHAANPVVVVNRNDLSVWVEGKPAPREVVIPAGPLLIDFRANPGGINTVERLCFKLEGHDPEWRESSKAPDYVMRLGVVFYDGKGNWLSEKDFGVTGNSPGWTGSPKDSPLLARKETISIPKGAATFAILLSSAGPSTELGVLAVGAFNIFKAGGRNAAPIWALKFPEGDGSHVPQGWVRTGSRPSMAQVVFSKTAPCGQLLAIVDDDIFAHGEWQSPRIPTDCAPGESLRMEWLESFSAGVGGDILQSYQSLEPGRYLFRFKKLTPQGTETKMDGAFALIVVPPFWKRTWFLVIGVMVATGLAIAAVRYPAWRQTRRVIAELHEKNAVHAERARIARDLHDTLEQGVTCLSIQIQCIARGIETGSSTVQSSIESARQLLKQFHSELRDSIWDLRSTELDRIDLGAAVKRMAETLSAGLNIQIELRQNTQGIILPDLVETNFLRIAQEAITNAIKNGGASQISIDLAASSSVVTLKISDNGKGFPEGHCSLSGNGHFGIQGMMERTQRMGGQLTISSGERGGCIVCVEVPLRDLNA